MLGQRIVPRTVEPALSRVPVSETGQKLALLRRAMDEYVDTLPAHGDFLRNYCKE
jgi:hypothetical protein